jgi:hypothetical protein
LKTVLSFFLIITSTVLAQEKEAAHNVFYLELMGEVPGFSFNYERETVPNLNLRFGLGISVTGSSSNSGSHTITNSFFIGMVNYLIPFSGNNNIETGLGFLTNGYFFPAFDLGYRYSPVYRGFLFKITINIITYSNGHHFVFGGMGFGFTF